MKKIIIVTGGSGYIGSHTMLELLKDSSYYPVCIDNFSNSYPEVVDRIKNISGKKFDFHKTDICNKSELEKIFQHYEKVHGIIHFAAYKSVGESCENPEKYYHNNILGLVYLLEMVKKYKVDSFIFSSSCSVYGNAKELPVTESSPLSVPESPYAHSKLIGEQIITQYAKYFSGCNYILLRYFNPVGAHPSGELGEYPIQKPTNLFPVITQAASGLLRFTIHGTDYPTEDGTCIRDYIHVCDIAKAHVLALNYSSQPGIPEIFNLGSGKGNSVLEIVEAFKKYCHLEIPYEKGPRRAGDVIKIYANNEKARKLLNWQCEYSLKDMVITAWKWQQNLNKKTSSVIN